MLFSLGGIGLEAEGMKVNFIVCLVQNALHNKILVHFHLLGC